MKDERILIRGGRVIDPGNGVDEVQPLCVADGRILAVGEIPEGFAPDRLIAAEGRIVCPGFVDLCVRLREPGQEHKGTIASEGAAAAAAGVTTLCLPPDTEPVIDTPALVNLIRDRAAAAGKVKVHPIGALTRRLRGQDLSEMGALREAGCLAVGNAYAPIANNLVLRRAYEYAATYDLLVIIRPEDPWLRDHGCAHEGRMASRLGLPGIPESAETVATALNLVLIEQTGVRAHFGQLSCTRAAALVAEARRRGQRISADVAIHQLHLTEDDLDGFDAMCHLMPPLRTQVDRDGLRRGLAEGAISALCSDHQPHEPDAKLDVFSATEPGMATLESLLPLTLRLVEEGILSLPQAIARLTCDPADVLGLAIGRLTPGAPADVCIFDPETLWRVDESHWLSQGRNTRYWGETLKGRITATLLDGRVVHSAVATAPDG